MDDLERFERAIQWAYEQAEPEWRNVARIETELRRQGFSRTEAKKLIHGAKEYERELIAVELSND